MYFTLFKLRKITSSYASLGPRNKQCCARQDYLSLGSNTHSSEVQKMFRPATLRRLGSSIYLHDLIRFHFGAESLERPLKCMIQGFTLRPLSPHLPAVIFLRRSSKGLTEYINLDVFRPNETTRPLEEANLTHESLPHSRGPLPRSLKVSFRQLSANPTCADDRQAHPWVPDLDEKHRSWCTHTWV